LWTVIGSATALGLAGPLAAQPATDPELEALDTLPPLAPIDESLPDPLATQIETPADDGDEDWGVAWPELGAPLPPLEPLPPLAVDAADAADDEAADSALAGIAPDDAAPAIASDSEDSGPAMPERVRIANGQTDYRVELAGVESIADERFNARFDALSELRQHDGEPANRAQIGARLRADIDLLDQLVRGSGHYDATVTSAFERDEDRLLVRLTVDPGPIYTYDAIRLTGLDGLGSGEADRLRAAFAAPETLLPDSPLRPLTVGDPVVADTLIAAQVNLTTEMRETGYPFGVVGEELVTIDHDRRSGTLEQPVVPGDRLRFGTIVADDGGMLGARHIGRIARFRPGQWYRASDTEDLRRALIATGLVGSVDIAPRANADGETVDVAVAVTPAPPRTISGQLGFSSGQGIRAEVAWEHRNLFPPEGALILRGIAGTREQLGSVTYRRNNWLARDRVLTAQALASNTDTDAFEARTITLNARVERASTLIYQKVWSWAVGAEIIGTDELAFVPARNADVRERYLIGGVFGLLSYDRSNDLLDPVRGFRLTARIAPEVSFNGGTMPYVRGQFDATGYLPLSPRIVLAGRARIGAIVGAERDDIAPSRRFYAGGGGSVRGYGYQRIGPRSVDNDPLGGTGLFELAAEARIKAFGAFSVVPFVDAGNVYPTSFPDLTDFGNLRIGAGVGIRYATNFGPLRVDVGTPLNPRPGDSRIGVYVSLGQAF
jgi:translocation and assembly module TamA